jgi:hypothetical protein
LKEIKVVKLSEKAVEGVVKAMTMFEELRVPKEEE